MARMEVGVLGPSSGHVHGHAGVEFDPAAGAVTIPREYIWLGWQGREPPSLGLRGLKGKAFGGGGGCRAPGGRTPMGG